MIQFCSVDNMFDFASDIMNNDIRSPVEKLHSTFDRCSSITSDCGSVSAAYFCIDFLSEGTPHIVTILLA